MGNFQKEFNVGGVPVLNSDASPNARPRIPGSKTWYVCSSFTGGPGAGNGSTADKPLATIVAALTAIAATGRTNRGDVIKVLPGHAEDISSADYASALGTTKGISIQGVGTGTMRPTLTWTIAGSTFLLDTNDCELANLNLNLAGAHAAGSALTVAAPITVSGTGCRIVDCFIYWGYDADQIVGDGITWTGANGKFLGNTCIALVAAVPTNSFMALTAADHIEIAYNYIHGPTDGTTRGVIYGVTTASIHVNIHHNYLHNILASSTIAMSLLTASTGSIAYNNASVESGILPFTASIGRWHQNFAVDTEGQGGALTGTASS